MSGKFLIAVLVGSLIGWTFPAFPSPQDPPAGRSVTELREDSEALLKKSKTMAGTAIETAVIVDLCLLHREVVGHPKFGSNPQLDSVRARIAFRLKAVARDLEKQLERTQEQLASKAAPPSANESSRALTPASRRSSFEVNLQSLRQAYCLDVLVGGPSQYLGYLPGNFAPPWDHGQELVNLIESTILPEFWQVNGGNGRIHYYQPLRILVVSGTSEMHDNLTDLLRRLRQLGR